MLCFVLSIGSLICQVALFIYFKTDETCEAMLSTEVKLPRAVAGRKLSKLFQNLRCIWLDEFISPTALLVNSCRMVSITLDHMVLSHSKCSTRHAWNVDEMIFLKKKTIVMNHFYLKPLIAFAWRNWADVPSRVSKSANWNLGLCRVSRPRDVRTCHWLIFSC